MTTENTRQPPKHTPGPWTIIHLRHHPASLCHSFIICADSQQVGEAVCLPWNKGETNRTDEQIANAQLIASAPDLLAALIEAKQVLETARRYFPKSIRHPDTCQLECVLANSVGKAINQAQGA